VHAVCFRHVRNLRADHVDLRRIELAQSHLSAILHVAQPPAESARYADRRPAPRFFRTSPPRSGRSVARVEALRPPSRRISMPSSFWGPHGQAGEVSDMPVSSLSR
jgi:hypothetical protein